MSKNDIAGNVEEFTVLCAGSEEERLGNFAPTITVSGLNGCFIFGAGVQVSDSFSPSLFQLVGGCRSKQEFVPIIPLETKEL